MLFRNAGKIYTVVHVPHTQSAKSAAPTRPTTAALLASTTLPAALSVLVALAESELWVAEGPPEEEEEPLLVAEGVLEGSPVVRGFFSLPSAGEISRPLTSPPLVA